MTSWKTSEERQASARARYDEVMTTASGPGTTAYTNAGVVGFVFGEMWQRGVITERDRRWITLTCVGAMGTQVPIESHVWAALNSGDVSAAEYDEFVLFFGTQLGWPKGSAMQIQGFASLQRLAEQRGEQLPPIDFEPWVEPADDETRRARGDAAYESIFGTPPPPARTAFRRRAWIDYLYGEIWTRDRYLTRRDKRIISICGAGSVGSDDDVRDHIRAALRMNELSYVELQEVAFHYAIYVGWPLGRRMDDLLIEVADDLGVE
jgi:4-carboxymuconolactone decarboxylase